MKKLLVMAAMVLSTVPAFAKTSSTVTLTSDYIWRGLEQITVTGASSSAPAVQGSIDYAHDSGFGLGVWASNTGGTVDPASEATTGSGAYEFDQYISYGMDLGGTAVSAMIYNYYFLHNANITSQELLLSATIAGVKGTIGYIPKYFGIETTSLYFNVAYGLKLDEKLTFAPSVGYTMFGDEKKSGISNYLDYKLAFQYMNEGFTTEVGYTDTNRQAVTAAGVKTDVKRDEKTYISLSKTF